MIKKESKTLMVVLVLILILVLCLVFSKDSLTLKQFIVFGIERFQSNINNDDSKIEEIWKKQYSLAEFTAPTNFKSYEELKTRLDAVLSGTVSVGNVVDEMEDEPIETPKVDTKEVSAPSDEDTMDYFQRLANDG